MRSPLTFLATALACASALAQAPAGPPASLEREALPGRSNQKVERLRHEDKGSRIEEVRVGGETRSITVQPKNGMPEYEVRPSTTYRSGPTDARGGSNAGDGQRMWNALRF